MRRGLAWLGVGGTALLFAVGALVAAEALAAERRKPPLERSLAWLRAQRGSDGMWRSTTYALLRHGESLTAAFALALVQLPAPLRDRHHDLLDDALRALAVRHAPSPPTPPEPVDYPCYTAAHRLHALALARPPGWREQADALLAWLRSRQLAAAQGWPTAAPEHGAFGLGAAPPQHPDGGDLVGLAVTTAVLEAAAASELPRDDVLFTAARIFVERCQGDDGGFVYAPTGDWRASKAGHERGPDGPPRARSYGTTTCDGIRALLALGEPAGAPRVQRALAWLDAHAGSEVPGLTAAADRLLEPSLRLYWLATLGAVARAVPAHPRAATWRELVHRELVKLQLSSGRFVGLAAAMKEDDPLIATLLGCSGLIAVAPVAN